MDKPTCKVNGMLTRGGMCSKVTVGLKYCGYDGECTHKVQSESVPDPDIRTDQSGTGDDDAK